MWWCLIFDFTFSIFARFCFFSLLFPFCVFVLLHIMCYSWIIYVSASHDSCQRTTPFSCCFCPLLLPFLAVYRTLIWIEIRIRMNISSIRIGRRSMRSPAGGNKANEGVAQLSWMSVTDHREVSVRFLDLQVISALSLSRSLALPLTVFSLMKK